MRRTVVTTPNSSEPLWLTVGLLTVNDSGWTRERLTRVLGLPALLDTRLMQRGTRIVRFLREYYPDVLSQHDGIRAGAEAMTMFIQLHKMNPERAHGIRFACFAGEISVARMRGEVQGERQSGAYTLRHAAEQTSGSRWHADFTKSAVDRITRNPSLLGTFAGKFMRAGDYRASFQPDLLVYDSAIGATVAVEVKAPREGAARSVSNVATNLVSRYAALRLRYDAALLVLPFQAESFAEQAVMHWLKWTTQAPFKNDRFEILLLDIADSKWITPASVWHLMPEG